MSKLEELVRTAQATNTPNEEIVEAIKSLVDKEVIGRDFQIDEPYPGDIAVTEAERLNRLGANRLKAKQRERLRNL